MTNYRLLLLLNLILIIAISMQSRAQETTVTASNVRSLRIDPYVANGGPMSQVFSEINFIPLETTKESLFGDIRQLEVTEKSYVILDDDTKCILTFDKQGKYRSKIELAKVLGAGALNIRELRVHHFELNRSGNEYTIQVYIDGKLYTFNSGSKLLKIEKQNRYEPGEFRDLQEGVRAFSYNKDSGGTDRARYYYALTKNGQTFAKYWQVDTSAYNNSAELAVGGPAFIETDDPGVFHVVKSYDYNIYRLDNKGMSTAYRLIFPGKNTLPADFNTNDVYLGKKIDYFFKHTDNIFGIGYTYKIGDFLYFKCGSLSAEIRKIGSLVYDLKRDHLVSLNRLDPDTLSHYLPVIGEWHNDFKKFDGTYLYSSLSSLTMQAFYEQEKKKKREYPPAMQNYFRNLNKMNNPVLIRLKPLR